jgi:DNA-binding transcriptional regulator YbjK
MAAPVLAREEPRFTARESSLLTAAVHVVATSGLRGLTHRAVDREAGFPEGTCSAYMRTRVALLTRLAEFVIARFAEDIAELTRHIEEHAGELGYAPAQTVAMLRSWVTRPDLLLVRMELTIEGSRQPAVAQVVQAQAERLTAVVEHTMSVAGHEHGHDRAVALISSIDGVLLRALREPEDERERFLDSSLRLLMGALVGPGGPEGSGGGAPARKTVS